MLPVPTLNLSNRVCAFLFYINVYDNCFVDFTCTEREICVVKRCPSRLINIYAKLISITVVLHGTNMSKEGTPLSFVVINFD